MDKKKKKLKKKKKKLIIGRTEIVDFPHLSLEMVKVKVDTGAYTSSFHCSNIRTIDKTDASLVTFELSTPDGRTWTVIMPLKGARIFKNSFGQKEKRYIISTPMRVFGRVYETEFSLTDREDMRYPVLLGRKFLRNGFVVDIRKKNRLFKRSRK